MNNSPGFFQHHLPHNLPYLPQGGGAVDILKKKGPLSKSDLKLALQKLVQVSQDMDATGKKLATSASSPDSFSQDKMERLSKEQATIIKQISDTAQNSFLKTEFIRLSKVIGEYQNQIKQCKSEKELEQIRSNMDSIVDAWVGIFKDIALDAINSSEP